MIKANRNRAQIIQMANRCRKVALLLQVDIKDLPEETIRDTLSGCSEDDILGFLFRLDPMKYPPRGTIFYDT